jgi:hypothetical protein
MSRFVTIQGHTFDPDDVGLIYEFGSTDKCLSIYLKGIVHPFDIRKMSTSDFLSAIGYSSKQELNG